MNKKSPERIRSRRVRVGISGGFLSLAGVIIVVALFSGTPQSRAEHTPLDWYNPTALDDLDGDKIEDRLIETTAEEELVDAVVCFLNDCVPPDRLADLACMGELGYRSTVVSSVQVRGVTRAQLQIVAGWPEVGYIHLDHIVRIHLTTAGQALGAHAGLFSPDTAEDLGYDGTGVTIAVLDTGCDDPGGPGTTHDHLPAAVGGVYVLDPPGGLVVGNPDDIAGHGTAVAGCALGRGTTGCADSESEHRGIACGASLFDCRITPPSPLLDSDGEPDSGAAKSTDIQRVVDWLTWNHKNVNPPIRVANISFGSSWESTGTSLTASIEALVAGGVVVCVSAGNDGNCAFTGIGNIAVTSRAITVAAATHKSTVDRGDDTIAPYSTTGPGLGLNPKPDVAAYGQNCSWLCNPAPQCQSANHYIQAPAHDTSNGYTVFGGTSAASPMVAGAAALLIQRNPFIKPAMVKKLLMDTAEDKGDPGWDASWGAGLMDLSALFQDGVLWIACNLRVKSVSYAPSPMIPNQPVTITVEIENVGTSAVEDFIVDFERWHFGPNAFPFKRYPIGGGPEENNGGLLLPGQTRNFQRVWTPGVPDYLPHDGKSCFWGIVYADCDNAVSNNQKNTNTYIDTLAIGGGFAGFGGGAGETSEVSFRIGHDRFGVVNTQLALLNPDPSNWHCELEVQGDLGQSLVVPVDYQACPVEGTLRTTPLTSSAPPVAITVAAADEFGMPLGDMTVSVELGVPFEACCFGDNICAELRREDCINAGGAPQGPNSDCNTASATCAPIVCSDPGDMNADGDLNGTDLPGFVACLTGSAGDCLCADVDLNGAINAGDIPAMVSRLLNVTICP